MEPTWEAVTQEVHTKYPDSDGRIRFAKVSRDLCPCKKSRSAALLDGVLCRTSGNQADLRCWPLFLPQRCKP